MVHGFLYPNFINDHWRIEGEVFFGDRQHFVVSDKKVFNLDEIVDFCNAKGIAFFDTACAVHRLKENASDKFLEVVEPTDINALLQSLSQCRVVVTTGERLPTRSASITGWRIVPKWECFLPYQG